MKARPSVRDWLKIGEGITEPEDAYADPVRKFTDRLSKDTVIDAPSVVANYQYLLGALRSQAPGQWSQNYLELSNQFLSVIFIAIYTMMKQSGEADMAIMEKTHDPEIGDIALPHTEPVCQVIDNPNQDEFWADMAIRVTQQTGLTGTALVWHPSYSELDMPTEMYVLPTSSCLPWPPSPVYPHGSYLVQPYYPYGPFSTIPSYQSAAGARIPAEQVMRIQPIPHPFLRYEGYSILTAAARHTDTVNAIDLARLNVQRQGVDTNMIITFDPSVLNPNMVDLVRLRQQIEAVAAGPKNAGKILFAPTGGQVERASNAPKDMAWTEGWSQLVGFCLACFGTPKGVAGLEDESGFAGLIAKIKQYNTISLCPHLNSISRRFTKKIVQMFFGSNLYMRLTPKKMDDEDLLMKKLATGIQAKNLIKVNEARKKLGMPPLKGPEGEAFLGAEAQLGTENGPLDRLQQPGGVPRKDGRQRQEMRPEIRDMERLRPKNPIGQGTLGPRKSIDAERLAGVLENAKTKGTAVPIGAYDDGAQEYLKRNGHGH